MIHGEKQQSVNLGGFASSGFERDSTPGQFLPGETTEAGDDARPYKRKLGPQMLAALSDFIGGWIAIAAGGVARIASHEIGDEDALQP